MDEKDRTIVYTESNGGYKKGYYYKSSISTAELRFLIDSVLSSNFFNREQAEDFSLRIQKMAGINQSSMTSYIKSFGDTGRAGSLTTMENLELLQSAIDNQRRISFALNTFVIEGSEVKLKPIENGGSTKRKVNPHYIKMINGKYYLIATYEEKVNEETKSYFHRVDLMSEIEVLEEETAPIGRNLSVDEKGRSRSEYQLMHPHMFSGPISTFQLKVNPDGLIHMVDLFGNNLRVISNQPDQYGCIEMFVTATKDAIHYLLLQYGESIEVINPNKFFSEEMQKAAEIIYRKYGK